MVGNILAGSGEKFPFRRGWGGSAWPSLAWPRAPLDPSLWPRGDFFPGSFWVCHTCFPPCTGQVRRQVDAATYCVVVATEHVTHPAWPGTSGLVPSVWSDVQIPWLVFPNLWYYLSRISWAGCALGASHHWRCFSRNWVKFDCHPPLKMPRFWWLFGQQRIMWVLNILWWQIEQGRVQWWNVTHATCTRAFLPPKDHPTRSVYVSI